MRGFELFNGPAEAGSEFHADKIPIHLRIAVFYSPLVGSARIENRECGSHRDCLLHFEAGAGGRDVLKGRNLAMAETRCVGPADLEQVRTKTSKDAPSPSGHDRPIGMTARNVYW